MSFTTLSIVGRAERRLEEPVTNLASITITHNFGVNPMVSFSDGGNEVSTPDKVIYNNQNVVTVSFDIPRTGTLLLLG